MSGQTDLCYVSADPQKRSECRGCRRRTEPPRGRRGRRPEGRREPRRSGTNKRPVLTAASAGRTELRANRNIQLVTFRQNITEGWRFDARHVRTAALGMNVW